MADIFSDLEKLGIGNVGNVFEDEAASKNNKAEKAKEKTPEEIEAEMLFDKSYTCPVCDNEYTVKAVRAGKVKMVGSDTDLRVKYGNIDINKYDALVCPRCGYAALSRYYSLTTQPQRKLIKEQIGANFKGLPAASGPIVTYDEAMMRMKLVLANAVVKKARNSEKAYICLKMAWLVRGRIEALESAEKLTADVADNLHAEELEYTKQAYTGFVNAVQSETFPMCGMDEMTVVYLMADLARRIGEYDQALKFLSEVIVSKTAQGRLKERARELKNLIAENKQEG